MFEIAAFYKFAPIANPSERRESLQVHCDAHGAKGIVLIAQEGVNGTIAAAPEHMPDVLAGIAEISGAGVFDHKTSHAPRPPFLRMKVRVKREIVTLGVQVDPLREVGTYVAPADWNALISDPDVLVLDVRNDYEISIGSFPRAIDPRTQSFSEFPEFARKNLDPARDRRIAMFCTGGIRCEKASAYLLGQGFADVRHLKGGVLQYLEDVPEARSLWRGDCFVFDQRVAVAQALMPADVDLCHGCRAPLTPEDRASEAYEEGVSCPRCHAAQSPRRKASARERQRQVTLAKARGGTHLGPDA